MEGEARLPRLKRCATVENTHTHTHSDDAGGVSAIERRLVIRDSEA